MNRLPQTINVNQLKIWLNSPDKEFCIVDVREDEEINLCSLKYEFINLPLSNFQIWKKNIPSIFANHKCIVVLCHKGIRSYNFGRWLLENYSEYDVWNLDGGIDHWAECIDKTMPRY